MTFVLGTWNLENLFKPGAPSGPVTEEAYQAKLAGLAATINRIGPDLLGVQEVGDPEALDDLVALLDGEWHTALSEHPDVRGIRVGFLSRLPFVGVSDTTDFPEELLPVQTGDQGEEAAEMGRGVLTVQVEPADGQTLTVATCHLKSKLLTFPGSRFNPHDEGERARFGAYALYRRAAEATTVRALADELLQGDGRTHDVAVLGDLNDEPKAATTQILYGPPGSQIGTGGFEHPDRGDAMRLWNLAPLIPVEQRHSRIFEGQAELIDHILASHALLARVEEVFTGTGEQLDSVTEDPAGRRDAPSSDHAPVITKLNY